MDIYLQIADSIQKKIEAFWPYGYKPALKEKIFRVIESELTADESPTKVVEDGQDDVCNGVNKCGWAKELGCGKYCQFYPPAT